MSTQLLLNAIIMGILLVSTGYMLRLNRRLKVMKEGFRDMKGLIADFSQKVDRSEHLLREMKASSTEISESMNGQISRAEQLHDDLATALAQANVSTNKLNKMLQVSERSLNTASRVQTPSAAAPRGQAQPQARASAPKQQTPRQAALQAQQARQRSQQARPAAQNQAKQPFSNSPRIAKPANSSGAFPARRLESANEEPRAKAPIETREHGGPAGRVWEDEPRAGVNANHTRSAIDSFFDTMRAVAD